ncbi:hypothetical protein N8079_00960 [Crocinitomicaceae bacterium]|jgi:hypothetical protein|nr:hypothetical protein [Crocinitomicaceae bacterium]MDG1346318.1 hypothetical protein [Crocinitomicaceae bacterium]MDG2463916.1 hypothetical protein [Crocinitomicaceae bacterium]
MADAVIGSNGEKVIVFYTFKDSKEFANFKEGTKKLISGSILLSSVFIVFVDEEAQKLELPDSARFNYLAKKDFNLLGQVKDKALKEKLKANYDVLLVFDHIDDKYVKLINKTKASKRIVSSMTEGINFDIRLTSSSIRIEQIASFAKETLEKIQS